MSNLVTGFQLQLLARAVREALQKTPYDAVQRMLADAVEFHGFKRSQLPPEFVNSAFSKQRLSAPQGVRAQIVKISTDLRKNLHRDTASYIMALGPLDSVPEPRRAQIYSPARGWETVTARYENLFPYGVPRGFTVEPNGHLFLLSVNPPANGDADEFELLKKS